MSKTVSRVDKETQSDSRPNNALEQYISSLQISGLTTLHNAGTRESFEPKNLIKDVVETASSLGTSSADTSSSDKSSVVSVDLIQMQKHFKILESGLNSLNDPLLILDLNSNVRFANPAFYELFSDDPLNLKSKNQLIRQSKSQFKDHTLIERLLNQVHTASKNITETEVETASGQYFELQTYPQNLDDDVIGQVWQFKDISRARLQDEQSKHRAYHDTLTGLPNRRLLSLRINESLLANADNKTKTAVLFIDLDGFKDVNDSLGHNVGDELLKDVAARLESMMPEDTFLARHGGDEFVAVMEKIQSEKEVSDLCHRIIDSFDDCFGITSEEIYMSVSIGIAIAPTHGNDADKLVSNADMAMYQAKQYGKHTYEFFSSSNDSLAYQRLHIRNQINVALEQEEFELFFQPKICLDTGMIRGAEALIRWRLGNGEFRNPLEFIPLAEESGQIIPISQWVIQRCCKYLSDWGTELDEDFALAINISAKHFIRAQLQQDLAKAIRAYNIDPKKIEIEVTETALMDNLELAVESLRELRTLGIRTAIDDFGTGHSSLNYLRKLPIEILKIDKSFIDEILTSPEDQTLVKGIIDMVHALGIEVVAEGVENHKMAETLMDMQCDLVQGYHYCRPVPEQNFMKLIKNRQCYI